MVELAKGYLADRTRALSKAIAGTLQSRRDAEEARRVAREAALQANRECDRFERDRRELQRKHEAFVQWTEWVNALKPGDEVYIKSLKRPAKVVRMLLHQQKAQVSAGTMDIEVPLRDIETPPSEQ